MSISRSAFIAGRVREVFLNGHWVANTNYGQLIRDLTWKQSVQEVGNLNTIASLVYHVNYYLTGLINVFQGGDLIIRDKFSFDLPPITSERDWRNLVDDFLSNSKEFASHVEKMDDDKLDSTFIDPKYGTYLRNIEGIIEHGYYHLGQISLIKKMILEKEN